LQGAQCCLLLADEFKLPFANRNAQPVAQGFSRKETVQVRARYLPARQHLGVVEPHFDFVGDVKSCAFPGPDDKIILHPVVPVALAYATLDAGVTPVENIVDAIPVCLEAAFNLLWELAWPLFSEIRKELLELDGRCATCIRQELKAGRPTVTISDEETITVRKHQRWLENLAFCNQIFR
jgi:hypothetical protein